MNDNKSMKEEHEFDSWRYSSSGQDQYQQPTQLPYYPQTVFPYGESLAPSSQPWSNGPEQPMTFLGQYEAPAQQHSGHYTMEAMFGSQNTYGFGNMGSTVSPFNAFFPSNSDPFWGGNQSKASRGGGGGGLAQYRMHETPDSYNYHHTDNYQMNDGLKHVDSGIAGLTLDHIKASADQFSAKSISGPFGGSESKKFDSIGSSSGAVGQVPKKMTWASIASQPAKPQPKSLKSKMSSSVLTGSTSKHLPPTSMETIGTWDAKNGSTVKTPPTPSQMAPPLPPQQQQQQQHQQQRNNSAPLAPMAPQQQQQQQQWTPPVRQQVSQQQQQQQQPPPQQRTGFSSVTEVTPVPLPAHPVLDKLRVENNYNPKEFDLVAKSARFFIIKSYSEDDIHRSIKYSIWCSTEHGNKRLDTAFKHQLEKGPIYLLYSVNGSGHFCGMAQMMSYVDYNSSSSVWAQDKWKGQFRVKWIYVKDVPNAQLRHIRLENNENKPVTNSRDTQEVPFEKGKQVIKIMHHFRHTTSIFDDFLHYEKRQEEESQRRIEPPGAQSSPPLSGGGPPPPQQQQQQQQQQQKPRQWKN